MFRILPQNLCLKKFPGVLRGGVGWGLGRCSLGEETTTSHDILKDRNILPKAALKGCVA